MHITYIFIAYFLYFTDSIKCRLFFRWWCCFRIGYNSVIIVNKWIIIMCKYLLIHVKFCLLNKLSCPRSLSKHTNQILGVINAVSQERQPSSHNEFCWLKIEMTLFVIGAYHFISSVYIDSRYRLLIRADRLSSSTYRHAGARQDSFYKFGVNVCTFFKVFFNFCLIFFVFVKFFFKVYAYFDWFYVIFFLCKCINIFMFLVSFD